MALVRVYCGLASVEPQDLGAAGGPLTTALVDDAGRVLDVRDIDDHPKGYAVLSSLLAERASGPYSVAIATDDDRHLVSRLLATAGWALAVADHRTTDDFSERFADEFADDAGAASPRRRALGLARALHAGVLAATTMPAPADLADMKPVLAADCALATGRYAAAVALREVLRELYPAALRAYPDPADPVAMAVMDALPEPGALATPSGGRGRDAAAAADAVTARLTADGLGDPATINEAITALRVAIAETPRRGINRALAPTVAETVRKSVAAVRACDESRHVLISALAQRVWSPPAAAAPQPRAPQPPAPQPPAPLPPQPSPAQAAPTSGYAAAANGYHGFPSPGEYATPTPAVPGAGGPAGDYAAAAGDYTASAADYTASAADYTLPAGDGHASGAGAYPAAGQPMAGPAEQPPAAPDRRPTSGPAGSRPVSAPPPPPPGITPLGEQPPANAAPRSWAEPHPSHASTAAPRPTVAAAPRPDSRVPTPRSAPEGPPPGGRAGWPTSPPADDWAALPVSQPSPAAALPPPPAPASTPPWRADDLKPPEPPSLRLVEPTLPKELRDDLDFGGWSDPPPLRLVESDSNIPRSAPPVDAVESDSDLLIFAQARSAWFTGQDDEASWNSIMDMGWEAAQQAARPAVAAHTDAGLPRRVPHANLVPGSPPVEQNRPLRVVRDPASIAAHTSGYFNGWRRGQEVGGYPLGTRSGPQSAGAWDFARDDRLSG